MFYTGFSALSTLVAVIKVLSGFLIDVFILKYNRITIHLKSVNHLVSCITDHIFTLISRFGFYTSNRINISLFFYKHMFFRSTFFDC